MYGWCLVSLFECHWHPHPPTKTSDRKPPLTDELLPLRNPYIGGYALKDPGPPVGIIILVKLKHLLNGEDSKLT